MDVLCSKFLGFAFSKKKNLPHAFTEAQVAMALYKKWQQINEPQNFTVPVPLLENEGGPDVNTNFEEDEEVEMSGQELMSFIKSQV